LVDKIKPDIGQTLDPTPWAVSQIDLKAWTPNSLLDVSELAGKDWDLPQEYSSGLFKLDTPKVLVREEMVDAVKSIMKNLNTAPLNLYGAVRGLLSSLLCRFSFIT